MTGFDKTLFGTYESKLAPEKKVAQAMPPENVLVAVKCAALHNKEIDAMVVRAHGRSGLRWQVFNLRGRAVSYPYRGWQPDSWRYKHKPEGS